MDQLIAKCYCIHKIYWIRRNRLFTFSLISYPAAIAVLLNEHSPQFIFAPWNGCKITVVICTRTQWAMTKRALNSIKLTSHKSFDSTVFSVSRNYSFFILDAGIFLNIFPFSSLSGPGQLWYCYEWFFVKASFSAHSLVLLSE